MITAAQLRAARALLGIAGDSAILRSPEGQTEWVKQGANVGTLKLLNLNRRNIELLVMTKLATVFDLFTDEQDAVSRRARQTAVAFVEIGEGRVDRLPCGRAFSFL